MTLLGVRNGKAKQVELSVLLYFFGRLLLLSCNHIFWSGGQFLDLLSAGFGSGTSPSRSSWVGLQLRSVCLSRYVGALACAIARVVCDSVLPIMGGCP